MSIKLVKLLNGTKLIGSVCYLPVKKLSMMTSLLFSQIIVVFDDNQLDCGLENSTIEKPF